MKHDELTDEVVREHRAIMAADVERWNRVRDPDSAKVSGTVVAICDALLDARAEIERLRERARRADVLERAIGNPAQWCHDNHIEIEAGGGAWGCGHCLDAAIDAAEREVQP